MTRVRTNRRRSRIVDGPEQARFISRVTAVPMTVLLLATCVLWVLTARLFDEAEASNAYLPSLGALALTQFLFVVLAGATAIWEALRYSHSVIGPAHRIRASLRRLREGDTDFRVELRSGDEMKSIARELNALIEVLERRAHAGHAADDAAAPATEPTPAGTSHGD